MQKRSITLALLLFSSLIIKAQQDQLIPQGTVQNLINKWQKISTAQQSETKVDQEQANKLFKAAARNDIDYITSFLESIQSPVGIYKYLSAKNEKGQNLIHIATKYRHKSLFNTLIELLHKLEEYGFNIQDILNARTKEGSNTALHYAVGAIQGDKNWYFTLELLKAGANVNIKNALNESPLDRLRKMDSEAAGKLEVMSLKKAANYESSLSIDESEESTEELNQRVDAILNINR